MRVPDPNLEMDLEAIVDRNGMKAVLEALAAICDGKADHVQTNWQDRPLAKTWERNAGKLLICARALQPTE